MFDLLDPWGKIGLFNKPTPYLRAAKSATNNFMKKAWVQGWQWKIEFGGDAPEDFDIYAKDIDFGMGSIDADKIQVGTGEIALPTFGSAGEITMTVRDDMKQTIKKWIQSRLAKVKNDDGTLNLPIDYVFELRIYTLDHDGKPTLYETFQVFPTKIGNATLSREGANQFYSYPIILQKFMSVGKKTLNK